MMLKFNIATTGNVLQAIGVGNVSERIDGYWQDEAGNIYAIDYGNEYSLFQLIQRNSAENWPAWPNPRYADTKSDYWAFDDPRWRTWGNQVEPQPYQISDVQDSILMKVDPAQFPRAYTLWERSPDGGYQYTRAARDLIDRMRAGGYWLTRKHPDRRTYNQYWGLRTPTEYIDIKVEGHEWYSHLPKILSFLSPVFIPPIAAALSAPTALVSTAVKVALGADPEKAIIGAIVPVVGSNIVEAIQIANLNIDPSLLEIDAATTLVAPDDFGHLQDVADTISSLEGAVTAIDLDAVSELLTAPQLLPELPPVFEPLPLDVLPEVEPVALAPVFEPLPLDVLPVVEPIALAPVFEPVLSVDAGYFEPLADDGGWMMDFEVTEAPPPPPPPPPPEEPNARRGGFFRRVWKFETKPFYVAPPEVEPVVLAPVFEPVASVDAGYFEPLPEPVIDLLQPPDLLPEPMPPTIEPPGVPIMDDFFTADDYAFRDFGSLDFADPYPIPTFDAGDALDLDTMPMFPDIDMDTTFTDFTGPITGGEVEDLVTVPDYVFERTTSGPAWNQFAPNDINVITTDQVANYIGSGGTVETSAPAGATVVEILKDATAAMVAALGLVNAYRALTSKPAPNPVAQARQGANTIRANPDGTITTTGPDGKTRTARPPVGQPQMTTDGSMIVNNGDGTYTRISRDGGSVVNRYPPQITERFGAAASSPYTLPLLIGGAALVLFAARRR